LVIAVILEGFEDSSSNEESNIVTLCIDIWRKYDPNCTMILPLSDCFDFMKEVAESYAEKEGKPLVQPLVLPKLILPAVPGAPVEKKAEDSAAKMVDVSGIPMRIANCSDFKLDSLQNMHFIDAVKMVMKVSLCSNSPAAMREIREKEKESPGLQKVMEPLEMLQKSRQNYVKMMSRPDIVDLPSEVASTKIQVLFKSRQARKAVASMKEDRRVRENHHSCDAAMEHSPTPPKAG
jgi:hypothetical protein